MYDIPPQSAMEYYASLERVDLCDSCLENLGYFDCKDRPFLLGWKGRCFMFFLNQEHLDFAIDQTEKSLLLAEEQQNELEQKGIDNEWR